MLSRADYIGLCNAVADGCVSGKFVDSLCTWLSKDNPKFKREKFELFLAKMIEEKRKDKGAFDNV